MYLCRNILSRESWFEQTKISQASARSPGKVPCSACVPSVSCSATEYELQKAKSEFAESSEQANREIVTLKEKVRWN